MIDSPFTTVSDKYAAFVPIVLLLSELFYRTSQENSGQVEITGR